MEMEAHTAMSQHSGRGRNCELQKMGFTKQNRQLKVGDRPTRINQSDVISEKNMFFLALLSAAAFFA